MRNSRSFLGAHDTVDVLIVDQAGMKSIPARISPDVEVSTILPNIIAKMQLPMTEPNGTPISYSLDWREGGTRLMESDTLSSAGVMTGHHLIVYPEMIAGELGCHLEGSYLGAVETVDIDIMDQTGAKKITARISSDSTTEMILPKIIANLMLPMMAPNGAPMSYSLDWKEGGIRLSEGVSLAEAGVQTGHHLIVYPEMTAGQLGRRFRRGY
jgi:hypothetical protein